MQPYIFGKRNLIHIINIKETIKGILLGRKFLSKVVAEGKDVLIVGTKRQARKAVEENAERTGMHSVISRWLGGTLTNFREIRKRMGRLEELEQMEADGALDTYSKKEGASLRREMRKIHRNLSGIRNMKNLPGALIVIDQKREIIAVKEANKLGIPVVCLLDTECDPDLVDIPIPGNDDAMRAIQIVLRELCDAIAEGLNLRAKVTAERPEPAARPRTRRAITARAGTEVPSAQGQVDQRAESPDAGPLPTQSAPPDDQGKMEEAQG
jgi:small subunit ribosomal protein S2